MCIYLVKCAYAHLLTPPCTLTWLRSTGTTTDCASLGVSGVPIPGDIAHITRHLAYQSDAQLVLVVEKDAVFQVWVAG